MSYQVVIAGGGMVGISLALALSNQLPGARLLLVESFALPSGEADSYTTSFDARSTALSYASRLIYEQHGLWEAMAAQAQAISSIHVSEQGRFGSTLMQAEDYDWPALGYVVENAWLGSRLGLALAASGIETRSPARVTDVAQESGGVRIQLDDGETIGSDLLVVADGAASGLRESLGIAHRQRGYEQNAVIANIGHRLDHAGRAFERFTPTGPLAMLPLPPSADQHRSALVWTLPPAEAETLMAAEPEVFLARLQREFGYRLGKLEKLGERHSYPLALVESEEQVRSGVVVMGNAAHSLHPVAGQGFNLALRDVASLSAVLSQAQTDGGRLGELEVLEHYRRAQAADQNQTTSFSDQLPGLFSHSDPALGLLRDFGLFALDLSPGLKRQFVRQTAGLAASTEYRDVQP